MDARDAEDYWRAISVIEAREALLALEITTTPHLRKDRAQAVEQRLQKAAYPAKAHVSKEHIMGLLAKMGKG